MVNQSSTRPTRGKTRRQQHTVGFQFSPRGKAHRPMGTIRRQLQNLTLMPEQFFGGDRSTQSPFDRGCPWKEETSDPSVALSTFSLERMREYPFEEQVELFPQTPVQSVALRNEMYEVTTEEGQSFKSPLAPLLAGGFEGSHKSISHLFEKREDGFPLLNQNDESTIVPGMFLCGPSVRHENLVFCFIYKYRQRFAVVAKAIATSLGLPAEELEAYRQWGMYLDDLSCCGEECATC